MKKILLASLLCAPLALAQGMMDNVKKEAAKLEEKAKQEAKKAEADMNKEVKKDAKEEAKKAEEAAKKAMEGKKDPAPPGKPAAGTPAGTPPAAGAAPPAMAMPEPSKELAAAYADLVKKKNINCKSKVAASPMGPAYEGMVKQTFNSDLNDYFVMSTYEEKKSKTTPKPYASKSFATWDPMKKVMLRTDIDNMGAVSHYTSPGWEGDKLVFTGKVMGGPEFRDTTMKAGKEWKQVIETKGPDGSWMVMVENTCK
jgi:hypothetical protein